MARPSSWRAVHALSALAALALGLRLPNLTWTNEITPIKQGGSVMLALFVNWFYAIALGGLYFLCGRYLSAARISRSLPP